MEWRPVVGYPGYEISDHGDVRSVDRVIVTKNGVHKRLKGRLLRPTTPGQGKTDYRMVWIAGGNKRIPILMLTTFIGPKPFPKAEARHLNGNPADDWLSNLTWGTKSENTEDSVRHGTFNQPWRYRQNREE